jgi:hypothetical protein
MGDRESYPEDREDGRKSDESGRKRSGGWNEEEERGKSQAMRLKGS